MNIKHQVRLRSRKIVVLSATASMLVLATGGSSSSATTLPHDLASVASGTPIAIQMPNLQGSTEGVNLPETSAAAQAAVEWVNHHGGVHGHPIALTICDLLTTPASDVSCANSMVAAKPAVIDAGGVDDETPIVTAAAAASIPFVTTSGTSEASLTSPDSFSFGPGNNGGYNLVAAHEAKEGGKSVSLVLISSPGALSEIQAGAKPFFAAHRVGVKVLLTPPTGEPDMTPTIQAATAAPASGVYLDEDPTTCIAGLNAKGTLGTSSSIRFYEDLSCETPAVIKGAGAQANGTYFATIGDAANPSDSDTTIYDAAMKQYAPSTALHGFALQGFIGIMDVVRVMQTMNPSTPITAASVKKALQSAVKVKAFLGDGHTLTCNGKAVPNFPSVCNGSSYLDQYVGGTFKYIGSATIPSGKA